MRLNRVLCLVGFTATLAAIIVRVQPYHTPTGDSFSRMLQTLSKPVSLADATPEFIPWDTVHIFTPYTSSREVCSKFAASWLFCRLSLPYVGVPEMRYLLVFMSSGKVIYHELPKRPPEYCESSCELKFERAVATFSGYPVVRQNSYKSSPLQ
jgi:hypothetical protein